MATRSLPRSFYARDSRTVAPDLLNKVLVIGSRAVRLVEVEAYAGVDDPASHAHRGQTRRNQTMFGRGGLLYVYFTYGMHWCANVVCGRPGVAEGVLMRAAEPVRGIEEMWAARPRARRLSDLCSGPAKLCQAMGIDGSLDGTDLTSRGGLVRLLDDGTAPPAAPVATTRIGITRATELPWRWVVPGSPSLSRFS